MALIGNLNDFDIADIILLIHRQRSTGALEIHHNQQRLTFGIAEGQIFSTQCEPAQARHHYLSYLVQQGKVDKEYLAELYKATEQSGLSPLDALLLEGSISNEDYSRFSHFMIRENLIELLTWEQGTFRYDTEVQIDRKTNNDSFKELEAAIAEGKAFHQSFKLLLNSLPEGIVKLQWIEGAKPPATIAGFEDIRAALHKDRYPDELMLMCSTGHTQTLQSIVTLLEHHAIKAVAVSAYSSNAIQEIYPEFSKSELTTLCQDLVRRVSRCVVSRSLYPADHPQVMDSLTQLLVAIKDFLRFQPELMLSHFESRLIVNNQALDYPNDQFSSFIELLRRRNIRLVTFYRGIDYDDLNALLNVLSGRISSRPGFGAYEDYLKAQRISAVMIQEISGTEPFPAPRKDGTSALSAVHQLFEPDIEPLTILKLALQDPTRLAHLVASSVEVSERVGPAEKILQEEILHNSLQRVSTLLSQTQQDQTSAAVSEQNHDIGKLLQNVIRALPPDMFRVIITSLRSDDQLLNHALKTIWMELSLDDAVRVMSEEYQAFTATAAIKADDKNRVIEQLNQKFQTVTKWLSQGNRSETASEFPRHLRAKLFQLGLPLKEIEGVIGSGYSINLKHIQVIEKLAAMHTHDLFSQDMLLESKLLIRDLVSDDDEMYLAMVIKPYAETLDDQNWEIRHLAASTLHDLADELLEGHKPNLADQIVSNLLTRLTEEKAQQVFQAILNSLEAITVTLKKFSHGQITAKISATLANELEQLGERSNDETKFIARALGKIGDAKAIQTLVNLIEDRFLYAESARSLLEIGDTAVQPLIELLKTSEKQSVRFRVAELLVEMGELTVPAIIKELDNDRWYVRRNACMLIRKICGPEMLSRIAGLIDDESPQVRLEAVRAIGTFGGDIAESLLLKVLDDQDIQLQMLAVYFLGEIGGNTAVHKLGQILEQRSPFLRRADHQLRREICASLGKLKDPDAVPYLAKLLNEVYLIPLKTRKEAMIQAIYALGQIGGKDAKLLLQQVAQTRRTIFRDHAKKSLHHIFSAENEF